MAKLCNYFKFKNRLEHTNSTKLRLKNDERELKSSIYSSPSPSSKEETSFLQTAKLGYAKEDYLAALVSTSVYVEIIIRRALTQANNRDYSKTSYHILLREILEQNLLSENVVAQLKFWDIRNKAVHGGLSPSKDDAKALMDIAHNLEQQFSRKLEASPILTERDRRIVATRFMEGLCELDSYVKRNGLSNQFTIDEIWDNNLGGFNKEIVGRFTISYFQHELKYIEQYPNGKISLTHKGVTHCGETISLPAGI
jgi:hypothetical protein